MCVTVRARCQGRLKRLTTIRQFGKSKIENLRFVSVGDKDVGGLNVAMDDALLVRCIQTISYLDCKRNYVSHGQRTRFAPNSLAKWFPRKQLHSDVGHALV